MTCKCKQRIILRRFKVVKSNSTELLEAQVNDSLGSGWELHHGITMVPAMSVRSTSGLTKQRPAEYLQTMVLRKEVQ